MQINFKLTMITLGQSEHHDFRFQNKMSYLKRPIVIIACGM